MKLDGLLGELEDEYNVLQAQRLRLSREMGAAAERLERLIATTDVRRGVVPPMAQVEAARREVGALYEQLRGIAEAQAAIGERQLILLRERVEEPS